MNLKALDNDCELIIVLFGNLMRHCMKVHHRVGAPDEQSLENGPPEETGVTPALSSSKFFNILFIRDFFVLLFIVNILHLKIPHLDY